MLLNSVTGLDSDFLIDNEGCEITNKSWIEGSSLLNPLGEEKKWLNAWAPRMRRTWPESGPITIGELINL